MRTVDELLTDFALHDWAPRPLLEQRIHTMAAFLRDYMQSYEQLSQTLQQRTAMLRDTQLEAATLAVDNEARRMAAARTEELVLAVRHWHTALGTEHEAQGMADLRETLTIYVHMEGGR